MKVLGLLLIIYALIVGYSAFAKPSIVWNNFKVEAIKKAIGENGTVLLFYAIAFISLLIGLRLLF